MIRASGRTGSGEPLLVLGVTGENVARLAADEPIYVNSTSMDEMELPKLNIVIVYGKTEKEIMAKLVNIGLATANTEVQQRER